MTGLRKNPPQHVLDSYSCTKEEWIKLRNIGIEMSKDPDRSADTAPLRAYQHQKHAAEIRRGIPFRLTLMEWWKIWDDSGHWPERGMGRGYMMCRIGDLGAYEVGNVFIGEGIKNLSDGCKVADLPIGVAVSVKRKIRRFRAYCTVHGKQRHIGLFDTVEEAEQAYLKVFALETELRDLADDRFEQIKAEIQGKPRSVVALNAEYAARASRSRAAA